jgi:FK506-binding nuclear protein
MYDPDSDEDEEYDLEPDMDEIDDEDMDEIDELDDMEDPRVTEIDDEDEAPKLIKAEPKAVAKANKNKRPAPDSADEEDATAGAEGLDEMIAKAAKAAEPTVNGEQKLSKSQKKKLKKNNGAAAAAPAAEADSKKDVEATSSAKSDKKVQFAKELEQGPTPTKTPEKGTDAPKTNSAPSLGVKTVQGVTIDDKKLGQGQHAKSGDRVAMRYIGKLKADGKVFDSNKKGDPFRFKLGAGQVIKGWEIGLQGIQAGGERRITIPAHLAYGSKGAKPDIPPNAVLMFDVKAVEVGK